MWFFFPTIHYSFTTLGVIEYLNDNTSKFCKEFIEKINNMNFNFKVFAVSPCLKIHSTVIMFWPHQRYSLICLQLDNIPKMQISQRVPVTTFTKIILLLIAWHTQSYLKLICNTPLMSSTRNNCFIALLSLSSLPL